MFQGMALLQKPQLRFVLAHELRQSLHLLQMSTFDLLAHIREQEQDNPLLDVSWPEDRFPRKSERRRSSAGGLGEGAQDPFYRFQSLVTLEQRLSSQIRLLESSPDIKRNAAFLAGNLDDGGYLAIELEEAAACMNVSVPQMELGLRLLQSCEPAGVAARSLEECLLLQSRCDPQAPTVMERLIREHLTDIAKGRWQRICRSLEITEKEASAAVRYLRRLNPRPGLRYCSSSTPYVIPDARLLWEEQRPVVRFHHAFLPKVNLLPPAWTNAQESSPEWRSYAAAKRKEGRLLIDGLSLRQRTLHRVIRSIAEEQASFLRYGAVAIRPLGLEQIAARSGVHPSTVSRAIRDKFVETVFGVIPLSRFFAVGIGTDTGESVSSTSVKCKIQAMIASENKSHPLSDSELAAALQREGIRISRRTVAKYREEERLLPSTLRSPLEFKG